MTINANQVSNAIHKAGFSIGSIAVWVGTHSGNSWSLILGSIIAAASYYSSHKQNATPVVAAAASAAVPAAPGK